MHRAVFLDRDGVLNFDKGYTASRSNFIFYPDVFECLSGFQNNKYKLFIVTNQSGVGRGFFSMAQLLDLHEFMLERFRDNGIVISDIAICPHDPSKSACLCRKPSPLMVFNLASKHNIDLKNSIFIGDKLSDMMCGQNAGIGNLFLLSPNVTADCSFRQIVSLRNLYKL